MTDLNEKELRDTPPLIRATFAENPKTVQTLLNEGHDPNGTDSWGNSAMHAAARRDNVKLLYKLQEHGGSIRAKSDDGHTVLSQCVMSRSRNVAAWLLDQGLDPLETNEKWGTPISMAKKMNDAQCVSIFSAFLAKKKIEEQARSLPAPHA